MKIHVVQENETLWTISQKYGVSLDSIIAANTQLANPDMIMPGMKITIPSSSGSKKQQQDVSKKQQQAQPQPQPLPQQPMQPPAKKDKKQQWLPDIKEDDDKKWEALKKEMPSLPLTFHTKDSMMPTKNKDYDKEANLQKQQAYLKPAQSKKEPKEQIDLKPPKHSKPSIPTPKTPSHTQPIAETPKQHQMPQQPMQPQLPQQPTVHQPVYEPDWCGQQPMWQHSHYDPCMQPYHTMDHTAHMMPHHHFGHMPQQGSGWAQGQVPQVYSPGQQGASWSQGQMPQGIMQNQQITNWGQGQMPGGNQQWMQGFPTQPNLSGQMQGYGGMNPMQSPYGMNQPNVQQQPFSNMPNRDDCGCGE